ncbi:MAG: tRNA (adenosine(37)-N6)-dimethylallyltransferase MiaA [Chloroflexi bacterium]|nr:tRNA (adenosine(37)-N6)-dimethylallyltransferase MiaA [Chloroflexota bacterium]
MEKIVIITGPTGVGKSATAIELAKMLNGELVNADSRQVYQYMDIGTAKPTEEEMLGVPHHLLSLIKPHQVFSVAMYQQSAKKAIADILSRHNVPIIVGGSGQYIWSLVEGWNIPEASPDGKLRGLLEKLAKTTEGRAELLKQLQELDAVTYERIDKSNMRRIVRAIEACKQQSIPFSKQRSKSGSNYDILLIGLTMERSLLYQKVDERVDNMLKNGLLQETQYLLQMYPHKHSVFATIGYKQLSAYINNQSSLQEAVQRIKFETHRYIRQQYTWFKPSDERINWFTLHKDNRDQKTIVIIKEFIESFLNSRTKGVS